MLTEPNLNKMSIDLPAHIFKAYDIRGIVGDSLTSQNVYWIGRSIGATALESGNNEIVVGRDGRLSGPQMSEALCNGLKESGINVIDIGMAPTPVVYFATHHLACGSSVSVTGSHNPPDYNGFKVMINGQTLHGDAITTLYDRIINQDLPTGSGSSRKLDMSQTYIDRICSDISITRRLKIVMDCGNGIAGAIAPQLYRALGLDIIELYSEVDGNFPNHHPDPVDEKNLIDLKAAVLQHKADFGIAFDGDGDRLGVVSSDAEVIWPDRQMILYAQDTLSRNPGAEILFDVKCTRSLPQAIIKAGGKPIMYKTGHSLIKAKLNSSDAILAGEMSGHIFFKERWYGFDDGLYTGARLCELISAKQQSAAEIFRALPKTLITPELRLELNEGEGHSMIEKLKDIASFENADVSTIDGLRVDWPFGFGLSRASNTTPTVILRFEADSESNLNYIKEEFRSLFKKINNCIQLPF
ncbi:MAG: phosphomannomutase/phosphoglucomutase [Parasphingorhabdus sp.]|jgi:phosphomannomutase/phosphoglucomutase